MTDLSHNAPVSGELESTLGRLGADLGVALPAERLVAELEATGRLTPASLALWLERRGLMLTPRHCGATELRRQHFPCLVPYDDRLLVGLSASRSSVLLFDPGARSGQRRFRASLGDLASHWNGTVLAISDERASASATQTTRRLLARPVLELRSLVGGRLGLAALGAGLTALSPRLLQGIVDETLGGGSRHAVAILAGGVLLCVTLSTAVTYLDGLLGGHFSYHVEKEILARFYRAALAQPTRNGATRAVGDGLARREQVDLLLNGINNVAFTLVTDGITTLAIAVGLALYDPRLALAGVLTLPLLVGSQALYARKLERLSTQSLGASVEAARLIAESTDGIVAIKACAAEKLKRHQWESVWVTAVDLRRRLATKAAEADAVAELISVAVAAACLYIALRLVQEGRASLGAVLAITFYFGSLLPPAKRLSKAASTWPSLKVAFHALSELVGKREEPSFDELAPPHGVTLDIEGVEFHYPGSARPAISEVTLSLTPGEMVAVVGGSGCGKTTLARIAAGSLTPLRGRSRFPVGRTALVGQENELFSGSVGENIAYSDDAPDEPRIRRAAAEAGALDFIDDLPRGLAFSLGEGGAGLSAGQRQRLSIAQALYREPRLLVLDEATSALDAETEKAVLTKLKAAPSRATLVVAHRLSTVRVADRIVVLDAGKIVEEGTHEALLARRGRYASLFGDPAKGLA